MRLLSFLFIFLFSFQISACPNARNRINKFFESRTQAFNDAKRDAKIPRSSQPIRVDHTPMKDINGKPLFDENHQMILTREYHYLNQDGKEIVIQEHTAAHAGSVRDAGGMAHLNVRPADDLRHGTVAGTAGHYNIGPE